MSLAPAPETPEVDDRRAAIEAAFEATEKEPAQTEPEKSTEPVQTELELDATEKPEGLDAPKPADEKSVEATPAETDVAVPEKVPQAWKATAKAKWESLDPEIRQEVLRREHQISTTLNETAGMRQFATQFQQAIQPYASRFAEIQADPAQVVGTLLKIDHILATGTPAQRAQQVASIISSAGVDIDMLANALSGQATPDPVSAQVEQLLQQRLQPFQAFMSQQEQAAKAAAAVEAQRIQAEVHAMSQNPKFPHFEAVRETMADLIQLDAAKINPSLTIESAYNKAVKMMDLDAETIARNAAAEANAKAQRALKASKSVSGAPRTAPTGSPASTDRRSIIEAAFDQLGGR